MNIIPLTSLTGADKQRIMNRAAGNYDAILPAVQTIMADVQKNGDTALMKIGKKWYGEAYISIQVNRDEITQAYKNVSLHTMQALKHMIQNITAVHKAHLPTKTDTVVEPKKGIRVWREWRAIEKVGLYIPGGKAVYPSSVLMTAIPAQIAGVSTIVMCSPAKQDGSLPAATLVAADMVGIKNIYKLGGAEAIAAMMYGTSTVPKVSKIFGAGGPYTTAAKILAQQYIAIDMPAGPSEVMIIADNTANPAFIAADLLADAEHAEDSACILLTTSKAIAEETKKEISKQLANLPTRAKAEESLHRYGMIATAASMDEIIEFSNAYAPEHLQIMTQNPEEIARRITNAGSVFLGSWTCKSSGDYATGANHVLPTGGMAKMYAPLGVEAYGKWMQVQSCTKEGLAAIRETIETVATVEELPAHKQSVTIRFTN